MLQLSVTGVIEGWCEFATPRFESTAERLVASALPRVVYRGGAVGACPQVGNGPVAMRARCGLMCHACGCMEMDGALGMIVVWLRVVVESRTPFRLWLDEAECDPRTFQARLLPLTRAYGISATNTRGGDPIPSIRAGGGVHCSGARGAPYVVGARSWCCNRESIATSVASDVLSSYALPHAKRVAQERAQRLRRQGRHLSDTGQAQREARPPGERVPR